MSINVNLGHKSYKVFINESKKLAFKARVALITNETIAPLHLQTLLENIEAKEVITIILKDGEEYKNMDSIKLILDALFKANFDRYDTVIGFGGGVITDMAGFASSIFLRGIDYVSVPTTLLSCVDAAVGGKTGVNTKYGKNLLGSFYQPKAVHIYTDFLRTLDKKEYANGVVEAIKMAVMFDKEYFDKLQKDINEQELIQKSIEIKAKVVEKDELEAGLRMCLNYGHTFAHVIEKLNKYKISHGEAVAKGILLANTLSQNLGFLSKDEASKIKKSLENLNLNLDINIKNIEEFYQLFLHDKKIKNAKLRFVIATKIGQGRVIEPKKEEIVKALEGKA